MNELTRYVSDSLSELTPSSGSDPVLARLLIEVLERKGEGFKTVSTDGSLYLFTGIHWERVTHEALKSMALELDGLWLPGEKPKRLMVNLKKAESIARTMLLIHEIREEKLFEGAPAGVAAADGFWTVDEFNADMLDHCPENLCTWSYDFEINPQVKPVKWLLFLDSLWRDDDDKQSKIDAAQEWLGACLIGKATDYSRALLCLGSGGNGKSLFMRCSELLFNSEQVSSASPKRWDHEYYVSTLINARLNVCAELPEYKALESSDMFKSVISGDRLSARQPHCPVYTFVPRCGHLFSANSLPSIGSGDYSDGFFRRFLVLSFNRSFTNDYALERRSQSDIIEEIEAERPAIVHWALEGASRLLRRGEYTLPHSHSETIVQWHEDSDPVKDFVKACCTGGESRLADLYDSFKDYCMSTGRRHGSSKAMAKRLRLHGHVSKLKTAGTTFDIQTKLRADWADCNYSSF